MLAICFKECPSIFSQSFPFWLNSGYLSFLTVMEGKVWPQEIHEAELSDAQGSKICSFGWCGECHFFHCQFTFFLLSWLLSVLWEGCLGLLSYFLLFFSHFFFNTQKWSLPSKQSIMFMGMLFSFPLCFLYFSMWILLWEWVSSSWHIQLVSYL